MPEEKGKKEEDLFILPTPYDREQLDLKQERLRGMAETIKALEKKFDEEINPKKQEEIRTTLEKLREEYRTDSEIAEIQQAVIEKEGMISFEEAKRRKVLKERKQERGKRKAG